MQDLPIVIHVVALKTSTRFAFEQNSKELQKSGQVGAITTTEPFRVLLVTSQFSSLSTASLRRLRRPLWLSEWILTMISTLACEAIDFQRTFKRDLRVMKFGVRG